jgi:hypothetical protein
MKNHKIANNSTTTKASEKLSSDLKSLEIQKNILLHVWLNFETRKY